MHRFTEYELEFKDASAGRNTPSIPFSYPIKERDGGVNHHVIGPMTHTEVKTAHHILTLCVSLKLA
jgi:hypothetical protein